MEEICQQIRSNKLDREYYKNKCATINNLGRKKWIGDEENPLLVAVECNRVDLVDFLIHLGVHVNSLQQNHDNEIKVNKNKILRGRLKFEKMCNLGKPYHICPESNLVNIDIPSIPNTDLWSP